MEKIEIKAREIENGEFVVSYTKKIIEILREPEMSIEVKAGQISDDVSRLVESMGYHIAAKKAMKGWDRLQVVKQDK